MSSYHLINVWTDAEGGAGGFVPMTESLLWLPEDFRPGHPTPGFVFLHRWGGYPYDAAALSLGPALADRGYAFLSLCLRRRGMEGQLNALPDDDLRDIKLAVDFLHTQGCRKVFLVGQELGGYSALRYLAKHRDRRIAGSAWLDPVAAPAEWLKQSVGDEVYGKALADAGLAARQGAAMDVRIDLLPDVGPSVTQYAMAFLAWWSPAVAMGLERNLEGLATPLLAAADGDSIPLPLAAVAQILPGSCSADDLCAFAEQHGAIHLSPVEPEILQVGMAEKKLFGLLWPPANGQRAKTAVLLVHGLTSSPLSPLIQQLAPLLAQAGSAVLAGEMQRSGWAGHENSILDNDLDDLDQWMACLTERGYERIVLAGASIGSISVGRYQSLRQHPAVAAVAHLMPTADCPDWFCEAAGGEAYEVAAAAAAAAIAEGRGQSHLVDVDIRQPPPNKYGGRFRWTQRAASWMSWWGPDADSRNSVHIANAKVPLLLVSGTEDSYNDEARFAELRAAAVNAPRVDEIWYPDIDHGLVGVERQVARDLSSWMTELGLL
jgi:alpha-beta hydrolase superfamily lysophospholipase